MLIDIIALFFLCKLNGNLALTKGLSAAKWRWITIASWFAAEIAGFSLGIILFGNIDIQSLKNIAAIEKSNFYGLEAMGLISAFGGYLIVRATLDKKPATFEEDINKINVNDLRPPDRE